MNHFTSPGDPIATLLERLSGVRSTGQGRWTARCPSHDDRSPSLSIRLAGDRLLIHCFSGCKPDRVLEAVGLSWYDLYSKTERRPWSPSSCYRPAPAAPATLEVGLVQRWQKWWDSATPGHPLLRRYLRARGLSIEPPLSLRLAVWETGPVMLARVQNARGELVGVHLTFLERDGSKRLSKRLAKGSRVTGGAIQLYPIETGKPLAVTEGIETGLAVRQSTSWPVWASVSAIGLERVVLPREIREAVICADHDQAGLEAARKLARRLLAEGRRVRLATPPKPGEDWLDLVAWEVSR